MVCKYNKNMSAFDKSMKSALFSFLPRGNKRLKLSPLKQKLQILTLSVDDQVLIIEIANNEFIVI